MAKEQSLILPRAFAERLGALDKGQVSTSRLTLGKSQD